MTVSCGGRRGVLEPFVAGSGMMRIKAATQTAATEVTTMSAVVRDACMPPSVGD